MTNVQNAQLMAKAAADYHLHLVQHSLPARVVVPTNGDPIRQEWPPEVQAKLEACSRISHLWGRGVTRFAAFDNAGAAVYFEELRREFDKLADVDGLLASIRQHSAESLVNKVTP